MWVSLRNRYPPFVDDTPNITYEMVAPPDRSRVRAGPPVYEVTETLEDQMDILKKFRNKDLPRMMRKVAAHQKEHEFER